MEFKGFDDWFEVFRAGTHTDSRGRKLTFSSADLDNMAKTYNASHHEAPIVIGHPKDNMPAWGWIKALKHQNGVLLAKADQVVPEFADMVKRGMFKKRSIALYPGNTLKHIGFLGAVPPAVKGLKDLQFAEDHAFTIELAEQSNSWAFNTLADFMRRIREYFIEKEGAERADQVVPNWQIEDIQAAAKQASDNPEPAVPMYSEKKTKEEGMGLKDLLKKKIDELPDDLAGHASPPAGQFSEADIEEARRQAKEQGKKEAAAEFAERERVRRAETRKAEIASFCDARLKEGKLIPAWMKLGLIEFMHSLDGETLIEFAEAGEKTQLEFFKAFLSELPKVIDFAEIAGREKDAGSRATTAGEKLDAIINQKLRNNQNLTWHAAFAEAQLENPDLAKEYQTEIGGE